MEAWAGTRTSRAVQICSEKSHSLQVWSLLCHCEDLIVRADALANPDPDELSWCGSLERNMLKLHCLHALGQIGRVALDVNHVPHRYMTLGDLDPSDPNF